MELEISLSFFIIFFQIMDTFCLPLPLPSNKLGFPEPELPILNLSGRGIKNHASEDKKSAHSDSDSTELFDTATRSIITFPGLLQQNFLSFAGNWA